MSRLLSIKQAANQLGVSVSTLRRWDETGVLVAQRTPKGHRRYDLSTIWAIGQGGASLLNSSFYQRYLGRRDTLRVALVQQMLDLPKQYPSVDEADEDMVDLVNQIDSESEAHLQAQSS